MRARRNARAFAATVFSLALAGAGGCSFLVSGDVPDVPCVEATLACPSGLRCDPVSKRCVSSGEGDAPIAQVDGDAATEQAGDTATREERDAAGSLELGSKCRINSECKTNLCASSTVLTTGITTTTGPICTSPCCTSAECPSTFVCFNGGTGGSYCVPAALAQRSPPSSGGKGGGVSCTSHTECRSGLCTGTPKSCLDTCCAATDCAATTTCRLKTVGAPGGATPAIWACAAPEPGANKQPGDNCNANGDCTTDTCIGLAASRICRPPCSNTASCKTVPGFADGHCLYGQSSTDNFRFCFTATTPTDADSGAACQLRDSCKSDYCDAELKECAEVCGKDSDCASGEACRPAGVSVAFLRCVRMR